MKQSRSDVRAQQKVHASAPPRVIADSAGVSRLHLAAKELWRRGRLEEAIGTCHRALRLRADDAGCWLDLGRIYIEAGRNEEAIECFDGAVIADPRSAEGWHELGSLLRRLGRPAEAARAFAQLAELEWEPATALRLLGQCRLEADEPAQAEAALREAVRRAPNDATTRIALAQALIGQRLFEPALQELEVAIRHAPKMAAAHYNAGLCLQYLGRFDEAAAAHARALTLKPDLAPAHYSLALMDRQEEGSVEALEGLLARPDLGEEDRINAGFALARLHDRARSVDAAFAALAQANALKTSLQPFDAAGHAHYLDRLQATFDAGFFDRRRGWGAWSLAPVFIVGMPRSGTSLVEQILASHPLVHGGGERHDIRLMIRNLPRQLGSSQPFPECLDALDPGTAARLGEDYLKASRGLGPDAVRLTDKLPGNYLRLGLIALILPEARIIHCRRDPLDTCLSCFFHNFASGSRFAYDLAHLGHVHRGYDWLMAHWRRVLPLPILELDYEALIEEPERQTRRLLAFCGLSFDERCLRFHEQVRAVDTSSFWQVRQPLYRHSLHRSKAYRHHLGPLISALEADGPAKEV